MFNTVRSLLSSACEYFFAFEASTIIFALSVALFFALFGCMFDIGIFIRPVIIEIRDYRLPSWWRKLTFQKKPYVISRPDLLLSQEGLVHPARVTTHDIDLMMHMNNSRYLREADVARFEWLHATGLFHAAWHRNFGWVTAAQSIRYRREIRYGVKYKIVTKCVGWDPKAIFLEHLFVVRNHKTAEDDIHAMLLVREGVVVPKKIKETQQSVADAPVEYILHDVLAFDKKQVPSSKQPPEDVANWLETLHGSYRRLIPGGHHHGHHHGQHHHQHHASTPSSSSKS